MKTLTGIVVANTMQKTVVVEVSRFFVHPLYKKAVKRSSRIKAECEQVVKLGDTVILKPVRPLSRAKHYVVDKIMTKEGKNL
jgi:small subunit ribosomal protein S17